MITPTHFTTMLHEKTPPIRRFRRPLYQVHQQYRALYRLSMKSPDAFWAKMASAPLVQEVAEGVPVEAPRAMVSRRKTQCRIQLSRSSLDGWRKNKAAIIWERQ